MFAFGGLVIRKTLASEMSGAGGVQVTRTFTLLGNSAQFHLCSGFECRFKFM